MDRRRRDIRGQRGAALLYAVFAITAVAVLGTGIYFMTTTSTFSGLGANDRNRAYQLALAGKDYAVIKNLENTTSTSGGMEVVEPKNFLMSNGDKFRLEIVNDDLDPDVTKITSTGIVKKTPYEASQSITVRISGFKRRADISFAKDIQAFTKPVESKTGLITTDTAAGRVSLGKITTGGAAWENNFGALWYRGNAVQGDCTDGRCKFGTGFRAFFVFVINPSGTDADGFTFAFFGGSPDPVTKVVVNDVFSVGGDTDKGADKGELMGYAGDSRLEAGGYLDGITRTAAGCPTPLACAAGRGIQPPKMAVEFDAKANNDTAAGVCDRDSRNDGSRDHMAYVFWGDETTGCDSTEGKYTFDDNKHGVPLASTTTNPQNASSTDTSSYYDASTPTPPWLPDWLTNILTTKIYAVRIEVTRGNESNASGNYEYEIKAWIEPCSDLDCTNYDDASELANTKVNYTGLLESKLKRIIGTNPVVLSTALHKKFDTFFFGWTTATGSTTQEILINRFRMNFRK